MGYIGKEHNSLFFSFFLDSVSLVHLIEKEDAENCHGDPKEDKIDGHHHVGDSLAFLPDFTGEKTYYVLG